MHRRAPHATEEAIKRSLFLLGQGGIVADTGPKKLVGIGVKVKTSQFE